MQEATSCPILYNNTGEKILVAEIQKYTVEWCTALSLTGERLCNVLE